MRRRALFGGAAALLPTLGLAQPPEATSSGQGGGRPARGLTLLVGGQPGGVADTWARGFAPYLERHLQRATVGVQAHGGDSLLAAARLLADSAPDGRMLGAVSAPLLLARAIEKNQGALLRRLDWLAAVAEEPVVLVAAAAIGDFAAFRALGQTATLGVPPAGTAAGLLGETLRARLSTGTLAFPSGSAARQAAMSGHVSAAAISLPEAMVHLREGRLVALALASQTRCPLLPEVPTLTELGLPLLALSQRGFVLPLEVPARQRDRLATALRAAVDDPEFIARGLAAGFVPRFAGPPDWSADIAAASASLAQRWAEAPWLISRG